MLEITITLRKDWTERDYAWGFWLTAPAIPLDVGWSNMHARSPQEASLEALNAVTDWMIREKVTEREAES